MFDARWAALEKHEIRRRGRRVPAERPGQRPRPDLPEGTDLLPQIKHIVVLMMENHSYDNYLGTLSGRGDGLPDGEVAANPRRDGSPVAPHHLTSTEQVKNDPTQSWHGAHLQWNQGRNDGFVRSSEQLVPGHDPTMAMGYWTGDDLPFYHGLARTFPLADRWFSSCLGPTFPNRRFMMAGTAHGLIDDLAWDILDLPPGGTIFDVLTKHGIGWFNYHNVRPARVLLKRALGQNGLRAARGVARVGRWFPRVTQRVQGNKQFTADLYPLGIAGCIRHLRRTQQFFADADAGTLPGFCIVDPDFEVFSEENPQDIRRGESFAAEVINRVMHGKGWEHTLLIWTYDEGGGYYDHVPPPEAVPPDDVPAHNPLLAAPGWVQALLRSYLRKIRTEDEGPDQYDRLGFRVPAVIVSPYARPDFVTSTTFDHTSILKLIEQKWNLPPLTRRDAAAEAPLDALDLDAPPAFITPPDLPAAKLQWGDWEDERAALAQRRGLKGRGRRRPGTTE
ncbi:MAG TPA: alkaline phosphatase family protein [Streptosporangiaceae bacterium]